MKKQFPQVKDYTGQFVNRNVECLYPTEKRHNGSVVWKLKCHRCGKEFEGVPNLQKKKASCGCLFKHIRRLSEKLWEEEYINQSYLEE